MPSLEFDSKPLSGDRENQIKQLELLGVLEVPEKADINKILLGEVLKYVSDNSNSETLFVDMGEGEVEIMSEPYDNVNSTDREIAFEDELMLVDVTEQATENVSYLFHVWIKMKK